MFIDTERDLKARAERKHDEECAPLDERSPWHAHCIWNKEFRLPWTRFRDFLAILVADTSGYSHACKQCQQKKIYSKVRLHGANSREGMSRILQRKKFWKKLGIILFVVPRLLLVQWSTRRCVGEQDFLSSLRTERRKQKVNVPPKKICCQG